MALRSGRRKKFVVLLLQLGKFHPKPVGCCSELCALLHKDGDQTAQVFILLDGGTHSSHKEKGDQKSNTHGVEVLWAVQWQDLSQGFVRVCKKEKQNRHTHSGSEGG